MGIKLSIVCATYNAAKTLPDFLDSYRENRVDCSELIIVDGGSSDNTLEIIQNNKDIVSKFLSEPDNGIYDAWNKAIVMCDGDYVSFVGSDDIISKHAMATIVDIIDKTNYAYDLISGRNILTTNRIADGEFRSIYNKVLLIYKMPIAHVMSAHKRKWLIDSGGFDSRLKAAGDYELLLRSRKYLIVYISDAIFAFMERGGISSSGIRPCIEDYKSRVNNRVPTVLALLLLFKSIVSFALKKFFRNFCR